MDSIIDLKKSDAGLDGLLDEISRQKKLINQIQVDIRALRTNEIKLHKLSESLKSENAQLKDDNLKLSQRVRELEIEVTLPTSERTVTINRIIDPYPKVPAYKKFNWGFVIFPIIAVLAVFAGKYWGQRKIPANFIPATLPVVTTPSVENTTKEIVTNSLEERYLIIDNLFDATGMVRVMDGYGQKARVLAWVNPGERFKIRAQSPEKMRRTYIKDGESVTYEDYFYKISDKEQWVFGLFTNKRVSAF